MSFSNARKMQKQCTEKEERNDNFLSMRTDSTVNQNESTTAKKTFWRFQKKRLKKQLSFLTRSSANSTPDISPEDIFQKLKYGVAALHASNQCNNSSQSYLTLFPNQSEGYVVPGEVSF